MAYDTKKLYEQALKVIEDIQPYWIEQLIAYMPCTKPTFYDHFKLDSNEFNTIKGLLEKSRIKACLDQDKKWEISDNPTLQISWRKLNGQDEERRKLSQSYQDITTGGEKVNNIELTSAQIQKLIDDL